MKIVLLACAVLGLALTASGAVGAHVVQQEIAGVSARWDSALLYGFAHVLAAMVAAIAPLGPLRLAAAWAFLAGVLLFSLLQIAGMIWGGGAGSPLDAVSFLIPVGGLSMMAGWVLTGASAIRTAPRG